MSQWEILDTGIATAARNMEIDSELLRTLSSRRNPLLHLYDWLAPSATFGYFVQPEHYLNLTSVKQHSLDIARRPTGGGILLHLTDFTFSMLIPANHAAFTVNTLDNYAFVNQIVIDAIRQFTQGKADPILLPIEPIALDAVCHNFCMSQPTKYDVMLEGRKVGGGAQRRTRHGFLHQGTIALQKPNQRMLSDLLLSNKVIDGMERYGGALIPDSSSQDEYCEARRELQHLLQNTAFKKE